MEGNERDGAPRAFRSRPPRTPIAALLLEGYGIEVLFAHEGKTEEADGYVIVRERDARRDEFVDVEKRADVGVHRLEVALRFRSVFELDFGIALPATEIDRPDGLPAGNQVVISCGNGGRILGVD